MILLSAIKTSVEYDLKHTVGTPITNQKFVEACNRAIDILQMRGNYKSLQRFQTIQYLDGEEDYDIENDLGVSDFNSISDISPIDKEYEIWVNRDERIFSSRASKDIVHGEYTIEERSGRNILRLLKHSSDKSSVVLHTCDSLTADGTWTTLADGANLTLDDSRYKEGSGCLNFDIDVSANAANYAGVELSTEMTAVDVSEYENIGRFRFDLDLQKLTSTQLGYISSAELRIGSSSSAYLAMTATSPVDPGGWTNNWNRVSFNWEDGTETGTPDYADVGYLAVIVNYSSSMTDATDIRVDEIKLFEPEDLRFGYYSKNMVAPSVSSTTFQEYFSSEYVSTECLRLPRKYLPMVVNLVLTLLVPQKKKDNDQTYLKFESNFESGLGRMVANGDAVLIESSTEETAVEGQAHGRDETHLQWG